MTREEWLNRAVEALESDYFDSSVPVRVSVGWPSAFALSKRKRRIGECWKPEATKDGIPHIFVSPILEEPVIVLAVLLHELIHARHPGAGHKGVFIDEAKRVGLEAPWTGTAPSDELIEKLKATAQALGDYPHTALVPTEKATKPQTTRMLKTECKSTGYLARMTKKWLDEYGPPLCPCCGEPMELEAKKEGGA